MLPGSERLIKGSQNLNKMALVAMSEINLASLNSISVLFNNTPAMNMTILKVCERWNILVTSKTCGKVTSLKFQNTETLLTNTSVLVCTLDVRCPMYSSHLYQNTSTSPFD